MSGGTSTTSVPVAQRAQQLRRRDHLHVLAHRGPVHRLEQHERVGLGQLVQHPGLGGDEDLLAVVSWAAVTIPLVDRIFVRVSGTTPAPTRYSGARRAAALGVDEQLGVGVLGDPGLEVGAVDAGVDVALAEPDVHVLAAQLALHVGAEELVGAEQHLGVGGDRGDDVDGVGRRAADVGLGLHGGGRVDVADDDGAGVLGLPRPQLIGGDRLGEAAAGALVGDQHGLVVGEDLRRLGHEVDAAEHDRRRLGLGGDAGQPERVADVVGDLLDLGQLVVVGQDHGVALAGRARAPARPSPGQRLVEPRPRLPERLDGHGAQPQRTVALAVPHPSVCRTEGSCGASPLEALDATKHSDGVTTSAASSRRSLVVLTDPWRRSVGRTC